MKLLSTHLILAAAAAAFPNQVIQDVRLGGRASIPSADAATAIFEPTPIFNAQEQLIDVSNGSGHEWIAPGENDIRGPCPGLNALANHGFLPRNGYATLTQFIDATTSVVGLGTDLATVLSVLGGFLDGDGTSWSIGGTPSVAVAGALGNQAHGISGSHNKYESDASPTRPDLYQTGNNYDTVAAQFNQLINMSPGGSIDLNSLTNFRSTRFDTQVGSNPYFFNGPFPGVGVQPAAYQFIYRFMANHSEANPYGLLTYDIAASWYGFSGTPGNYKLLGQGYERIPDNWYRRAKAYPYDGPYFAADATNAILLHPKFADIGGNTGSTNSFTGINVTSLTSGVFNSATLAQNNNFACLAFQFAAQEKPDLALNIIDQVTSAVGKITGALSCPQLSSIDNSELQQFPGYTKSQ